MGKLASVWKLASSWYISLLFVAAAGVLLGYLVFFQVFPGKPKIGIIDIPFTVLTDDSAFVISSFLDYTRRNDDIKAVVIRLNSPGGSVAASEQLFIETRKLREEKPVVIVIADIAASGGYMMSLGANHTFAKTGSMVGSVGVIVSSPGPLIPTPPTEDVATSGPFKLSGGSRRYFVGLADELKTAFIQMVLTERGDKLRLSPEEITQARIYTGAEGVKLGLVDAIGGDTEAIEKAADLADISGYDLVDVNVEVFRLFNQKIRRIEEPLAQGDRTQTGTAGARIFPEDGSGAPGSAAIPDALRRLFLPPGIGETQEDALPGFPLTVNPPNLFYLYVGPSQ